VIAISHHQSSHTPQTTPNFNPHYVYSRNGYQIVDGVFL